MGFSSTAAAPSSICPRPLNGRVISVPGISALTFDPLDDGRTDGQTVEYKGSGNRRGTAEASILYKAVCMEEDTSKALENSTLKSRILEEDGTNGSPL